MIMMQTFVCVICGSGWPVEIDSNSTDLDYQSHQCSMCGRLGQPRGTQWARIPLRPRGDDYAS